MTREERLHWLHRLKSDISYVDFSVDVEISLERKNQYRRVLSEIIEALEQEPRKGHWIRRNAFLVPWKCSECNYESERYENYCPNCGAKMESEVDK